EKGCAVALSGSYQNHAWWRTLVAGICLAFSSMEENEIAAGEVFPGESFFGSQLETPGPASPATDIEISEIMFDAPDVFRGVFGDDLDWVELYNSGPLPTDISGYQLTGDIGYVFPEGTILTPGRYLVIADKPSSFAA